MQVAAVSTYGVGSSTVPSAVWPVLQAQDGSFYGTDNNSDMISFSQSGNVIWSVPNDYPHIATADGGVIGVSGITYDGQGHADGQDDDPPIQSWTWNPYLIASGSVVSVDVDNGLPFPALGFWSFPQANQSSNVTATKQVGCPASTSVSATTQESLLNFILTRRLG
jgi:hypothetical protein